MAAFLSAVTSVLNRSLKQVHYALVMFYHGCLGLTVAIVGLSFYCIFSLSEIPVFTYTYEQYKMLFWACMFDSLGTFSQTIAF